MGVGQWPVEFHANPTPPSHAYEQKSSMYVTERFRRDGVKDRKITLDADIWAFPT